MQGGPQAHRPMGVLGGTFDPIHYGHLELAREVRVALQLPEVVLLPAGDPAHRAPPVAAALHRLAMVEIALDDYLDLRIDAREIVRAGRSYTVSTLQELRAERPFQPVALIVGGDAFAGLPTWHEWRQLFTLAHLVVVARPGLDLEDNLGGTLAQEWQRRLTTDPRELENVEGGCIYRQSITPHAISASAIRAALWRGDVPAVKGLLPPAVLAYIERNHLYRPSSDAT